MFTDNTLHKINKNNAEIDRNGSKAYRVLLQFPVSFFKLLIDSLYKCHTSAFNALVFILNRFLHTDLCSKSV